MRADNFTFYNRSAYFRQLTKDIRAVKPGGRVAVATMTFQSQEPLIAELVEALVAAARRGAEVRLCVDARTFLEHPNHLPGPLWYRTGLRPDMPAPFGGWYEALERLRQAGGKVAITNQPRRPFSLTSAGRSHIKAAVVGDGLYIGGCNLEDAEQHDVMVRWSDKASADWVYAIVSDMAATGDTKRSFGGTDRQTAISPTARLLLDAGNQRQSLILDEAHRLIDEAKDWLYMTCQFFPGGQTGQHLQAAVRRGVNVCVVFAHPRSHRLLTPLHALYNSAQHLQLPAELFANRLPAGTSKLHAKVLASEQAAMVGSHNYVVQGVYLGTAEIALLNRDPAFSAALRTFTQTEIETRQA